MRGSPPRILGNTASTVAYRWRRTGRSGKDSVGIILIMEEKNMEITQLNKNILTGEYNPGNGTNYKVIAIRWPSGANFNRLGSINPGGWLVVNCKNGLAHLFQEKGLLADSYIQEKIGGLPEDYPYFGDLVRELISRV